MKSPNTPKGTTWTFYKNPKAWIVFGIIIIGFIFFQPLLSIYKRVSLQIAYDDIVSKQNTRDCPSIYDYVLPSERITLSLTEFVSKTCPKKDPYSINAQVNSIRIDGDIGTVNRTLTSCYTQECLGSNRREDMTDKLYYFIGGKWYFSSKASFYCNRKEPFDMPAEFSRAVSLVIERFGQSTFTDAKNSAESFKSISNCLDIQYASSDDSMKGAEGLFLFDKSSSRNHLKILVSPSYQNKDDLLTATLLTHEMTHADSFAEGHDKEISCYENEAEAIANEYAFMLNTLNPEEANSLLQRFLSYTSATLNNLGGQYNEIFRYSGNTFYDKTLKWVQNNPFYQKECNL